MISQRVLLAGCRRVSLPPAAATHLPSAPLTAAPARRPAFADDAAKSATSPHLGLRMDPRKAAIEGRAAEPRGPAAATLPHEPSGPFDDALPPQVLINCLKNNIFVSVHHPPDRTLFSLSAGLLGYTGSQKTSTKSALALLDTLQAKLAEHAIDTVRLNFRGINAARSVIVGQLRRIGLKVTEIIDTTGIPFNGCRPPKARSR